MQLPQDFCIRMEHFLGEESADFFKSYEKEHAYGLRLNLLSHMDKKKDEIPFSLSPVPWCKEGFYVPHTEHPGKHPLHAAGAYYIQEPSAMSVVTLLSPAPGETICDLCAAPGGKSTQIAGCMQGKGLLVSNEIIPSRSKILAENMERFGVTNAVITNESPDYLASYFPDFFDKILVDAPCSGEGMFRKDETAIREWSKEQVQKCAERQKQILMCAEKMLKPDGVLVYSTCTFSEEENEQIIQWFLEKYPEFMMENWQDFLPDNTGIISGENPVETMRLFPHRLNGEGHFAARLKRKSAEIFSEISSKKMKKKKKKNQKISSPKPPSDYLSFLEKYMKKSESILANILFADEVRFELFGEELYQIPPKIYSFSGLKTVRAGLHLGTQKKNRFEPSHALAKAAMPTDVLQSIACDHTQAAAFLHGETLSCDSSYKGWILVCYQGLSLGWGKADNGIIKNHYPKGLRI